MIKKVLVAYFSLTGNAEKMAQFVSEGVRFTGNQAVMKKISELKKAEDLAGYDGYIFGCSTYHHDMTDAMKTFLFLGRKAGLEGKLAGAFGSYTHDPVAPKMILDTMQYVYKMEPFELGAFNLKEPLADTNDGMRACQAYGKAFGEKLGS